MMTVKELKELLNDVEDEDMEVLIPGSATFDGIFLKPCICETGVSQMPEDEDEEDPDDFTKQIDFFLIAPHGFADEPDENEVDPEMN